MNVVAVIQARMSSSRLPGKVMLPLAGKPALWHVVLRRLGRMALVRLAITREGMVAWACQDQHASQTLLDHA
jgi:spore coat polysaccharide biosynthesis protein SpsF